MSVSHTRESRKVTIREFNIILYQQTLKENVSNLCLILSKDDKVYAIDDGNTLYNFFFEKEFSTTAVNEEYQNDINYYAAHKEEFFKNEKIVSFLDDQQQFNVFVPFGPLGEFTGAVFMKISPDFSNITTEISSVSGEAGAIFSALILLTLLANFYMSSYMLTERDTAQQLLFNERQIQIKQQIEHEKEALFTKRIYHAHHKAEKIMGFIKMDIRSLNTDNIKGLQEKIIKYANFVSRVIYDMKSYEPPINVIRNPAFQTKLNDVVRFIVRNIFLRSYRLGAEPKFDLVLEENLPNIPFNEYVVWEIIEPLIQNCIEHNSHDDIIIKIQTTLESAGEQIFLTISDNGRGIDPEMLMEDEKGIKRIFLENTTSKKSGQNSGYGCYLAYEISRKWCGWTLDAENSETGGAVFTIKITV
ncbi:MAG: ATP-binding protein [Calditrichaceae bacterium]